MIDRSVVKKRRWKTDRSVVKNGDGGLVLWNFCLL